MSGPNFPQHHPVAGNRSAADHAAPNEATAGDKRIQLYGVSGIIFGLVVCPLVGLIFSIMSLRRASESGDSRILGYLGLIATAIGVTLWVLVYNQAISQEPLPAPQP